MQQIDADAVRWREGEHNAGEHDSGEGDLLVVLHGLGSIPYVLARPALAQTAPRKNLSSGPPH